MGGITSENFYKNLEVSAAGNVNWYNVPNTELIISPFETDSLHVNQILTDGAWKVGVGYSFKNTLLHLPYLNQLLFEINAYQTFTTLNGGVWQFELPEFNNYNFNAPVISTRLMFDFKQDLITWHTLSSYAILGVGATWNTVSYHETVTGTDISPASALSLSNNTTTQVAWDVGVGLRIALMNHLSATAEYIYAFLGHGSPANESSNRVSLSTTPRFSLQTQSNIESFKVLGYLF